MTIYTARITASANSIASQEIELEGYAITHVEVLFPPGCLGLVGVSFFYGVKQIFPYQEGTDLRGSGETIAWDEYWVLPEERTKVKVVVNNEDDTYPHTIYIRIVVKKKKELLSEQITNSFISILKRLFGYVT